VGVSKRVITYYNGGELATLRRHVGGPGAGLGVSNDELFGMQPVDEETSPKTARLLKLLRKIEELPPADRRAVLKFLDALLENRGVA
jgi:hypothetical protein